MTEQDGNRVGTVKKLGNSYFVRLVEPVSEPWHVAWSDGLQLVSGWQDDEAMADAEVVGFVPVAECGPPAATQTAEQARPQVPNDWEAQIAHAFDHAAHFQNAHGRVRNTIKTWLAGSPVTETTTQDEDVVESEPVATTLRRIIQDLENEAVFRDPANVIGEYPERSVDDVIGARTLREYAARLRKHPSLSGVTSETEKR